MKKLLFSLIAILGFALNGNAQDFEESIVIISKGGKEIKGGFANTLEVKNFNSNFKVENTIALNFSDYTDDGKNNDLKAGDGIYTSVKLYKTPLNEGYLFMSDKFKHSKELENYLNSLTSKVKVKIGCKIRRVHSGNTVIFGTDCSTHWCIELYDCTLDVEWEW